MNNLLNKIWGEAEGFRCVVSGKMKHDYLGHNDVPIPANRDTWFAPSIFKSASRKAENVVSSRAFYLDIDCKEGTYEGITEAAAAVLDFADRLGLSSPCVVRSGNGIHCYWILTRHINTQKWLQVAKALQLACADLGLQADHSVTKDIARILRVPGTFNYKDPKNPKPVELLTEITEVKYEELEEALADYIYQVDLAAEAKESNKQFGIEYVQTPKDANTIADGCAQVRMLRDTRGNLPEPVWYAGLGVIALCTDGIELAQKWSAGHPDYNARSTERKFERAKEFAPTTCQKFKEVNPDGCKGCPYAGKITSPIQLGETLTEIERPAAEHSQIANRKSEIANRKSEIANRKSEIAIPPPLAPEPYKVGKEGVYILVPATDTEPPIKEAVLFHPLWVSRLMVGEDGTGTEIELTWINAEGTQKTANFRQSLMSSPQAFEGALRDRNIYFFASMKNVLIYINKSIQHVAKHQKEEIVYGKFGFTGDNHGFIIGESLIRNGARETANITSRIDAKRIKLCAERGSLENWREAGRLLNEPRFWMHRFTVLACLGSPLLALSGNEGSILSLAGESSGGKTTSANLGIAAFANPKAFTIDPQSTMKSFYEHWRQAGNLPVVVNEAATIRKEILSNLALAAANGKARDTMTQDGRLNDSGVWETLTIFTSNMHLLQLPHHVLTDACKARILELPFLAANKIPLHIGRPINALLEKNHGIAGRLFLDYVMAHQDEIAVLVNERVEKLEILVDSVHRYNVWLIAAASVAGEIAKALRLIDFDIDDAIENAIKVLKGQAAEVKPLEERILTLISDYVNKHQADIGIKAKTGWHQEPRGEGRGRIDNEGKPYRSISIPVRMLKDYAMENGIDARGLDESLTEKKQTRLSATGGAIYCYVISPWAGE